MIVNNKNRLNRLKKYKVFSIIWTFENTYELLTIYKQKKAFFLLIDTRKWLIYNIEVFLRVSIKRTLVFDNKISNHSYLNQCLII